MAADPFSFLDNTISNDDPFADNLFGSNQNDPFQTTQSTQPPNDPFAVDNYDPFGTTPSTQRTQPQTAINVNQAANNSNAWSLDPFAPNTAFTAPQSKPPPQAQAPALFNTAATNNWDGDPFAADPFAPPQQQQQQNNTSTGWDHDPFADDAFNHDPFAQGNNSSNNNNTTSNPPNGMDLNFLFAEPSSSSPPAQKQEANTLDLGNTENNNTQKQKKKKKKKKKKTPAKQTETDEDERQHYKQEIVDELYNLGVASKAEIIGASKQTVNWKDINAVKETLEEMQRMKQKQLEAADDDDGGEDYHDDYGAFGGMDVNKVTEGPPTQKTLAGYTRRNQVQKSGHVYVTGAAGFRITISAGKEKWGNKFTAGDFGFGANVQKIGKQVSEGIDKKTIRLYYHDTDPNNQPILADYGGKHKLLLYPKNPNEGGGVECKVQ